MAQNIVERIDVASIGDILRVLELPIDFRRFYWLKGPCGTRGRHAHRKLVQVFVSLGEPVTIRFSNGHKEQRLCLGEGDAVLVPPGLWREIEPLPPGAILGVLASESYSEKDYIRDYDEFLKWSKHDSIL